MLILKGNIFENIRYIILNIYLILNQRKWISDIGMYY